MKTWLSVIVALSLAATSAWAATPTPTPRPAAAGKLTTTQAQANPLLILENIAIPDLEDALADAQAHNDPINTPCWQALLDAAKARQAPSLALPKGIFSAIQRARDLEIDVQNALAPNNVVEKINASCARAFLHGQNILLLIGASTGIVVGTGGLSLPALPGMLPLLLTPK